MKDYGLQAIGDRIIVLQDPAQEKSDGGVLIAVVAQERPLEGTVVGLGTDEKFHVRLGSRVLFAAWSGIELKAGQDASERLLVLRESELLCVRASSEAPKNGAMKRAGQEPVRS